MLVEAVVGWVVVVEVRKSLLMEKEPRVKTMIRQRSFDVSMLIKLITLRLFVALQVIWM
jgi:hypothetical protein